MLQEGLAVAVMVSLSKYCLISISGTCGLSQAERPPMFAGRYRFSFEGS
jgi:hypothetical protein